MNVTINIYGDIHIHCDCDGDCGIYGDELDESCDTPDGDESESAEPTAEEIEAVVKAVVEVIFPFLRAEMDG